MKIKYTISLLLTFCSLVTFAQQDLKTIDKIIGVVGNEIILKSELMNQSLQRNSGTIPTDDIKAQVMEELLFQKLLVHQAKVDSVEVSDQMVQSEIDKRLEYYIAQHGSQEKFEEFYGKSITEYRVEFEEDIRNQLLAETMQRQLFGNTKITPGEVLDYFKTLPKDSLPLINSTIEYSQLVVMPEVTAAAKEKTKHIMDSIRNLLAAGGSSLALEAAKWSEDPGSKYKGGCYPIQRRGSFVPEYEAAVYNTPEGGYSSVFETTYGYHFVYVKEKRGEMYEACHVLMSPQVTQSDLDRSKLVIEKAYTNIKSDSLSFEAAVKQYSTDEDTKNQLGKVVSPTSGSSKMEINEIPPNIYFIIDKLEEGGISEPALIELSNGKTGWVIFQLTNRTPAHQANMKDDYLIFSQQAEAVKKNEKLRDWIEKTIDKTYVWMDDDTSQWGYTYNWLKRNEFGSTIGD